MSIHSVFRPVAEVDGISALVGVRLERGDRVVVDRGEVRDVADRVIAALEAEAAGAVAGGAHAVAIQRQLRDLGAAARRRRCARAEKTQPGRAVGRDDLAADGQRGEAWRAVLPDDRLRSPG